MSRSSFWGEELLLQLGCEQPPKSNHCCILAHSFCSPPPQCGPPCQSLASHPEVASHHQSTTHHTSSCRAPRRRSSIVVSSISTLRLYRSARSTASIFFNFCDAGMPTSNAMAWPIRVACRVPYLDARPGGAPDRRLATGGAGRSQARKPARTGTGLASRRRTSGWRCSPLPVSSSTPTRL